MGENRGREDRFGRGRGAWLARGRDAVPDVRRRADAVTARNREERGEMVVMAVS